MVRVPLEGVEATLLWTLYHRATEARRPDAVLNDPVGVELVDRIDFPFQERFGDGSGFGQWQALRARRFDRELRRFLVGNPGGTVVALGEGLETSFWRVDDGRVRWLTVDVPATVAVRDELLPPDERRRTLACSALDLRWMEEVDPSRGLLLTAQGLLMYFTRDEVHGLIGACAERFGGAALVFDAVPAWMAARSRQGRLTTPEGYGPPPWQWGMDGDEERALRALPGVASLRALRLERGRGAVHGTIIPLLARVPLARRRMLSVLRADFA